ncbi:MAG TPA: lysophospholipid acyltransferase family protein [Gemmatimonadaceae bacterium]
MLYPTMRALARIALRWYYREIEIVGAERVPRDVPMLVVANHPNAMIDPMLVATTLSRRVTFTGKATLFENPFTRFFLGALGMVPLRRASDERARREAGGAPDPSRNADAFRAVVAALAERQAVLIFPEGKSHDEPSIAPLKTGTARMALQARAAGVGEIAILPMGFVFEDKARPRTRILVEVGEPIRLEEWLAGGGGDADALTAEIDRRLRALTMNFESADAAAEVERLAAMLAAGGSGPLGSGVRYADTVSLARRIDEARRLLAMQATESPPLAVRARSLRDDLRRVAAIAGRRGIDLRDATIDTSLGSGALFALREGALAAVAVPVALAGRLVHWPAVSIARAVARRTSRSGSDPAMQTMLVGAPLVLVTWLAVAMMAWRTAGPIAALVLVLALPALALADVAMRDRAERARARSRAYFTLRHDRALQHQLLAALSAVRNEAAQLEEDLRAMRALPGARSGAGRA